MPPLPLTAARHCLPTSEYRTYPKYNVVCGTLDVSSYTICSICKVAGWYAASVLYPTMQCAFRGGAVTTGFCLYYFICSIRSMWFPVLNFKWFGNDPLTIPSLTGSRIVLYSYHYFPHVMTEVVSPRYCVHIHPNLVILLLIIILYVKCMIVIF